MQATIVFALCFLATVFGQGKITDDELKLWFETGDKYGNGDGDGTISAAEFKDWESRMRTCKDILKWDAKTIFDKGDKNGDNMLQIQEHHDVIEAGYDGKKDSYLPKDIDFYFSMMDKNKDDEVSLKDLQTGFAMFRKHCAAVLIFVEAINAHLPQTTCIRDKVAKNGITREEMIGCIKDMKLSYLFLDN